MQSSYWVGDYLVDPTRNQIKHLEQVYLLQPKVGAVLNLLAQHAGKVVTHEQLMNEVWPNIYVTPNTLQRCIAELRKAFADDSKNQNVIKTHSKQGYSLELLVKIDNIPDVCPSQPIEPSLAIAVKTKNNKLWLLKAISAYGAILLIGLSFIFFNNQLNSKAFTLNTIHPLTASDEKEFYPNYSADGQYMVFHRYLDVCQNHIWAKNLLTQQEFRLTREPGIYGAHSWSPDGKQLVFTLQENCSDSPQEKTICWRLQTLDFNAALQSPQNSMLSYDCDSNEVSNPRWLNGGNILVMQLIEGQNKLVKYNPTLDQLSDFYTAKEEQITYFDYAVNKQAIAIFSQSNLAQHYLRLLDLEGNETAFVKLKLPNDISIFSRIEPNYVTDETGFIAQVAGHLYHIDLNGEFTQIHSPHSLNLHTPTYHPTKQTILATKGLVDSDIALVTLGKNNLDVMSTNQPVEHYASLARSTSYDAEAVFQPNSDNITFISHRTDSAQIWSTNNLGNKTIQLSQFPKHAVISSFSWSQNGHRLATSVNDHLLLLTMDGQQTFIETDFAISRIFHWTDTEHLLLSANHRKSKQLIIFNIKTKAIQNTGINNPYWAHLLSDGSLLYIDANRLLWRNSNSNSQEEQITDIESHLDGKRFVMREDKLYGINWRNQLWQFEPISKRFTILDQLNDQVWWVSDVYNERALLTQIMASRQEIIELSP